MLSSVETWELSYYYLFDRILKFYIAIEVISTINIVIPTIFIRLFLATIKNATHHIHWDWKNYRRIMFGSNII